MGDAKGILGVGVVVSVSGPPKLFSLLWNRANYSLLPRLQGSVYFITPKEFPRVLA